MRALLCSLFVLMVSCYGQLENREQVLEAMNAMEIKRVTDIQLAQWVRYQGDQVSRLGQKALNRAWIQMDDSTALQTKLASLWQLPIPALDSIANAQKLDVYRVGFDSQLDLADSLSIPAMELLAKYRDKEIPLEPQAKVLENPQIILYTSPVILNAEARGIWVIYYNRTETIRRLDMDEFEDVILNQ